MAEAMCGPANPLQQFKQQTTLDRSLQQDRLAPRNSRAQGFRSLDPNAALLDPQFEAFQAGVNLNQLPTFHQSGGLSGPSQVPEWTTDFQRLNLSPPSVFQPQHHHQSFPASHETASWATGFLEQRPELVPRTQSVSPSPQAFQQRARYGLSGFQNSFGPPAFAPAMQSAKGKAPVTEQFDEAAFALAFDSAREDMVAETHQETMGVEDVLDAVDTASSVPQANMEHMEDRDVDWRPEHTYHATDIEHQPAVEAKEEVEEMHRQQSDDDALAATAQELLEKIEHNKTEKFKNSQFLGLMRKLRDREVRVEGDKMVETANATSSSTTALADATLNATSSTTAAPLSMSSQHFSTPLRPDTVGTQPRNWARKIPPSEQDYDSRRMIDPVDGQAVVDLLNERGPVTDDMDPEFMMTSPYAQ